VARVKVTAYTAITNVAPGDLLVVVDVNDDTMAATGTTKKMTLAQLLAAGTTGAPGDASVQVATDAFVAAAVALETARAEAAEALAVTSAGDISGTTNPQVVSTHLAVTTVAAATVTQNLDPTSGRVFAVTQTGNCAFSFNGESLASSGTAYTITLYLWMNATGGWTTTFPTSVTWLGGIVPALNTASGALNVLVFETINGGVTWYGALITEAPSLPLSVPNGGTGVATLPAFQVLLGNGTGVVQAVAGVGTTGYVLTSNGAGEAPTFQQATGGSGGGTSVGMFGDGSDGTATLDGTATVAWASKSGSTYTMTRDAYLTSLTINTSVQLNTVNFKIFCTGTVTVTGTLASNGLNATSATGAAAQSGSTIDGNSAGSGTITGAGGTGGSSGTRFGTGTGSGGGAGSTGTAGPGGGAQRTTVSPFRIPFLILTGYTIWQNTAYPVGGACGGGGGGGDGTYAGGGGGAGGGILCVFAHAVVNNGVMEALGGNGFTPVNGNCGGGGGGGGGVVLAYTLAAWTGTGTTSAAGGTQGSGVGTGAAGTAGTAGTVLNVILQ
jgi:hypothetical protein